MSFKTDDPIKEAMDEVIARNKCDQKETDQVNKEIDWENFFGENDITKEEVMRRC